MPRAFASAIAQGITGAEDPEVLVSFYGPRGGNRGIESLTPASARKLGEDLIVAADEAEPPSPDVLDRRWRRAIGELAPTLVAHVEHTLRQLEEVRRTVLVTKGPISDPIDELILAHRRVMMQVREKQLLSARSAEPASPSPNPRDDSGR